MIYAFIYFLWEVKSFIWCLAGTFISCELHFLLRGLASMACSPSSPAAAKILMYDREISRLNSWTCHAQVCIQNIHCFAACLDSERHLAFQTNTKRNCFKRYVLQTEYLTADYETRIWSCPNYLLKFKWVEYWPNLIPS